MVDARLSSSEPSLLRVEDCANSNVYVKRTLLSYNICIRSVMDAVCVNDCNTLKQLIPGRGRVGQQVLDMAMLTASREGFTKCARVLLVRGRTSNGLTHRLT